MCQLFNLILVICGDVMPFVWNIYNIFVITQTCVTFINFHKTYMFIICVLQNFLGMNRQTDVENMWSGRIAKSRLLHGAKLIIWLCVSDDHFIMVVVN